MGGQNFTGSKTIPNKLLAILWENALIHCFRFMNKNNIADPYSQ
jgi:hypothetical protein